MWAIICFNICTASFFISKIWPVLRLRLFQPRFHVNSDEETPALILSIFWSFTHPNVFFSIIRKYMISLLAHKMKSLNKTFTLVSAGFETCQDRQRRLLFDGKNGHVTITWHAVVPCEHSNCRQVHDHHFFRWVWGTSVKEDEIWGQFPFEPRFHTECHIMV